MSKDTPDLRDNGDGGIGFEPLRFDAREFLQFVADESLTEEQEIALTRAIWEIVVAFVDLRFGLSPLQHVVDASHAGEGSSTGKTAGVLSSSSISHRPEQETAGRASRATAAKEDS
jgi:hypothetical protein